MKSLAILFSFSLFLPHSDSLKKTYLINSLIFEIKVEYRFFQKIIVSNLCFLFINRSKSVEYFEVAQWSVKDVHENCSFDDA